MELIQNTSEHKKWIEELKFEIQKSQIKASISVNQVLLNLTLKKPYKFDFLPVKR